MSMSSSMKIRSGPPGRASVLVEPPADELSATEDAWRTVPDCSVEPST